VRVDDAIDCVEDLGGGEAFIWLFWVGPHLMREVFPKTPNLKGFVHADEAFFLPYEIRRTILAKLLSANTLWTAQ